MTLDDKSADSSMKINEMIEKIKQTYVLDKSAFSKEWQLLGLEEEFISFIYSQVSQRQSEIANFLCSQAGFISNANLIDFSYKINLSQSSESSMGPSFYITLEFTTRDSGNLKKTLLNLTVKQFYKFLSEFEKIQSIISTIS